MWNVTAKEDLNQRKEVFLLNFILGPPRSQKFGLFSLGNSLNKKILLCESLGLLVQKLVPGLLVVASYPCRIGTLSHLLWYSGWHVTSHI